MNRENFARTQDACRRYWQDDKRAAEKRALIEVYENADDEAMREIARTLTESEDKDELNRAALALRTRADGALAALRDAACVTGAFGMTHDALSDEAMRLTYLRARVGAPYIDRADVCRAVRALGVRPGEILLVHSAYASLGHVLGGAQAVVDGLLDVVGDAGTLVMPTLSQQNFENAYKDWTLDRPSDTGYLTEYFRKLPGVLRSDQATHSVAAFGRKALELTREHCAYGPRPCLFGEYAFGHSSPWQKMYDIGGKVVFLGAKANTNTFKHFIECCQVERRLDAVRDPEKKRMLLDGLWTHDEYLKVVAGETYKAWPMYKSIPVTQVLDEKGFVAHGRLGDAELLAMDMQDMVREVTQVLESDLARWYPANAVDWFRRADAIARESE